MIADPSRLRRAAEHEAAHAVVADALGMAVGEVQINDDGTGACEYRSGGRINDAAVAVAGALWISDYRWQTWPGQGEAGCEHDMRTLALCDAFDRREAQQRASKILSERGDDVIMFAEHLMNQRRADWDQFRQGVDDLKSGVALAIGEHGLEAVRAARRSGNLPALITGGHAQRGPQPPPGWNRAAHYPAGTNRAAIPGEQHGFQQQLEAYRDAWLARKRQEVGG
ncbi:hypothetical protein AB0F59_27640 [Micromonospora lupini]|uniref:hypothetical protein n=1 Tax=Micromonospora lupini TaxID=285679 RepID=UPI003406C307